MKSVMIVVAAVALVAVTLAAPQEDAKAKAVEIHKKCITDSGANEEEVLKARKGQWSLENEALHKYAKCYFEQEGVINAKGDFDKEAFLSAAIPQTEAVDKKEAAATVDTCLASLKNAIKDEFAYKFSECFLTKHPTYQF